MEFDMLQAPAMLRHAYRLAEYYSDDPVTKTGAVLVNANGQVIAVGTNSLPRGVKKLPARLERPTKYEYIGHAERKAIFDAARTGAKTEGATLFCPWYACSVCAQAIIDAGIKRVIGHQQMLNKTPGHWLGSIAAGNEMFADAGVETLWYDGPIGDCVGLINGEAWNP